MLDAPAKLAYCDDTIPEPLNDRPEANEKNVESIIPTLLDRMQNWGSD